MHGFLHATATLLLIPYFVLAAFFALVGRAAASGSWWDLFDLLANTFSWTVRLGIPVAIAFFLILAGAGFFSAWARTANFVLTGLSGLILVILLFWPQEWPDAGQWLFFAPCVLIFAWSLVRTVSSG
jgi:hypothetical protein